MILFAVISPTPGKVFNSSAVAWFKLTQGWLFPERFALDAADSVFARSPCRAQQMNVMASTTNRMKNFVRASFSRTTCLVSIKRDERIESQIMDHESLITSLVIAGATATLRFKPNVRYHHIFVHGLAHIVDRE